MNILLLIESAGAGAGRHVMDLAESLTAAGHSVHLIYNFERTDSMFRRRLANAPPSLRGIVGLPMHHSPHPHDIHLIARLRAYVRRHGPFDILHCHSTKAGFIGRLGFWGAVAPIVYTPHGPLTMCPSLAWGVRLALRGLEVGLSCRTWAIIAVSEQEADHLASLGISRRKLFVVPNGVGRAARSEKLRSAARSRMAIHGDQVVVGAVGRLERPKRVDLVLRAVSGLPCEVRPKIRVAVIGGGSLEPELRSLASSLDIAHLVTWVGEVEDAGSLMTGLDVCVLATDYEAMPYVLLEAAAAGVPLVATRVGGVENLVTDGLNGFLVERGDVSRMASCIASLVEQSDLRKRMADEALHSVSRFSLENMAARTFDVYSHVLSRTNTAQAAVVLNS